MKSPVERRPFPRGWTLHFRQGLSIVDCCPRIHSLVLCLDGGYCRVSDSGLCSVQGLGTDDNIPPVRYCPDGEKLLFSPLAVRGHQGSFCCFD